MGFYNWISQMPFVDEHQLNLDFILSKYKKLEDDEAEIAASKEAAAASATEAAESATEAAASAEEAANTAAAWLETETFINALNNATDTYLNENGVVVYYENIEHLPPFTETENLTTDFWTQGGIVATTGVDTSDTTRIRSIEPVTDDILYVIAPDGFSILVYAYNPESIYQGYYTNGSWVTSGAVWQTSFDFEELRNNYPGYFFRIVARKNTNGDINPAEGNNISIVYNMLHEESHTKRWLAPTSQTLDKQFLMPVYKHFVLSYKYNNLLSELNTTAFALQYILNDEAHTKIDIARILGVNDTDRLNGTGRVYCTASYDDVAYIRVYAYSRSGSFSITLNVEEIEPSEYISTPNTLKDLRLYAHKGYQAEAPENSIPAFRLAGQYGFWGVETDLHATSDGIVVCMHDATIDRMTDGTGAIASMTYTQLSQYHIDTGANVGQYSQDSLVIPTIDDYLSICRYYGMVPFIELKTDIISTVLNKLAEYGLTETAIISSTNWNIIVKTRSLSNVFVHWIREDRTETHDRDLVGMGNAGRSYNYQDLTTVPNDFDAGRKKVGLRYCFRAGDTVANIKKMVEIGVDYIPTNTVKPSQITLD